MRTTINLATQPYEDVRSFTMRWGLLLTMLAIVTAGAVYMTYGGWRSAQGVAKGIAHERSEMARMDREIAGAQAILNQSPNKMVRDQSAFLNELIARKAFSWTRVFSDLERLIPPRLHVISITPELDEQNQLGLKMTVAGDSRERVIELLHRMEASKEFKSPQLIAESVEQSTVPSSAGRAQQFQITAVYVPASVATRAEGD